jgi:hypothetical protein
MPNGIVALDASGLVLSLPGKSGCEDGEDAASCGLAVAASVRWRQHVARIRVDPWN